MELRVETPARRLVVENMDLMARMRVPPEHERDFDHGPTTFHTRFRTSISTLTDPAA
jgi:hypothetical protein